MNLLWIEKHVVYYYWVQSCWGKRRVQCLQYAPMPLYWLNIKRWSSSCQIILYKLCHITYVTYFMWHSRSFACCSFEWTLTFKNRTFKLKVSTNRLFQSVLLSKRILILKFFEHHLIKIHNITGIFSLGLWLP